MNRTIRFTGLGLVALMAFLPGCAATKKYVDEAIIGQDTKIQSVESGVEENQARILEVGEMVGVVDAKAIAAQMTGDEALEVGAAAVVVAEEAKMMAGGQLVYSVTLTDDSGDFKVNNWVLPGSAMKALDDLAKRVLSMNKRTYIEIAGHADSTGTEKWNEELGWRRAEAARRYLAERGIPLYAMSIISMSSSKPIADNSTREGRAQNRRVVVKVLQ